MQQRTGSVYLDAPTRTSRAPVPEPRGKRGIAAMGLLGIGLVGLTVVGLVTGLRLFVLDPDLVDPAVEQTLADPIGRAELEHELATAIVDDLVGEDLIEVAAVFELDVADEANRLAPIMLDDPTVRTELKALAGEAHHSVLVDPDAADIDLEAFTTAILAVVAEDSPRLAAIIPPEATLWTVDVESLPDLTAATTASNGTMRYALLALVLIPIGFVVHPRRHCPTAWIGRWALTFGLVCALAAVGFPYLAGELTGYGSVEIAVRTVSLKLLAPAAICGIVGIGLVSFATALRKREKRRVTEEGAAAALGYDEPPLWQQAGNPTLDLSGRGLVDVNHPLTNI